MCESQWMKKWTDEWILNNKLIHKSIKTIQQLTGWMKCVNEWIYEWVNAWMTDCMNDWMHEWLNAWMTDWMCTCSF